MLQFLRKHQSYIFAAVTFVIVISFSFFGTYNTLPSGSGHDQVAFVAIDGTAIKRSELDQLVHFIGTDNDDKLLYGGAWGPNFLNDGVIRSDFLTTGLAEILINEYPDLVQSDFQIRHEKEKRYSLYSHPNAKFLSVEGAWIYFAPQMKGQFDALRGAESVVAPEAISARIELFLAERKFPAPMLQQVLRYQQKQFQWLTPDPSLERMDLSLFGYHTVEDWFGPRFVRLIGEFIINSSKIAEEKGYKVTKAEALADLMKNSEISFKQNAKNPQLGVANRTEYFNEQLRRLGMDQNMAANAWRQVLLFRRLFQDVGSAVLVDPLTHQKFYQYAKESISGDLYQLPEALRFADYDTLQKFEVYLSAVSKRAKGNNQEILALPTTFLTTESVKTKYPELVQRRYRLKVTQVNKKTLQAKVGLKEMWGWESDANNWQLLKKEFPDLGTKKGDSSQERMATLDALDKHTRSRIDAFARAAIVDKHPEWLQDALSAGMPSTMTIGISAKGGKSFVTGLEDRTELIKLLDEAPLPGEFSEREHASEKLSTITGDQANYYRIVVLERSPHEELLTFAEANKEGILDVLLNRQLEIHYQKMRENRVEEFRMGEDSWKPLAEVKSLVADDHFKGILRAIRADFMAATNTTNSQTISGDQAASLRLFSHVRLLKDQLQAGSSDAAVQWISPLIESEVERSLQHTAVLADQWKIKKETFEGDRSTENPVIDLTSFFLLPVNGWSQIYTPVHGDLYFFQLKTMGNHLDEETMAAKLDEAQKLLSDEAQQDMMYRLVNKLKEKQAISLDYLDRNIELTEEESAPFPEV